MTQKIMAMVQKLATIYCCARECMAYMVTGVEIDAESQGVHFLLLPVDVEAAWDIAKQSMHTYKHFKVL